MRPPRVTSTRSYCKSRIEYLARLRRAIERQRNRSTTHPREDVSPHQRHLRRRRPIRCGRNGDSEVRRSKRSMRSGMRNLGSFEIVPRPANRHCPSAGPTESVQFCTDAAASASATSPLGRGQRRVAVDDAQRYRTNAADCILAAERFEPAYRDLTFAIAESWLSLARQQEAMDAFLTICSKAESTTPIRPAAFLALRGTPGQMGNCLMGGKQNREIFMSYG